MSAAVDVIDLEQSLIQTDRDLQIFFDELVVISGVRE